MVQAKVLFIAAVLWIGLVQGQGPEYHSRGHSGTYPSYNHWTSVGNVQLRLTDRTLSFADAARECARLGGTLFDPGSSSTLLYDVADRLYGDGQQVWVNMEYVTDPSQYAGIDSSGWYWMNSRRKSNHRVYRRSQSCTSGALTKLGSSVILVGDEPWRRNIALCMIDRSTSTVVTRGPIIITTPTTASPIGVVTGGSTPCVNRVIQAQIPFNQTGVVVQINPTSSLTLTNPGTYQFQEGTCSVIINVTKAATPSPSTACPNSPAVILTTSANNTAPFNLPVGGSIHTIQLPVGTYNYTIQTSTGPCVQEIRVLDGNLIRRVDIVSRYTVDCNIINAGNTKQIVDLFAKRAYGQLSSITGGKVTEPTQYPVTSTCANNILTVTWPTATNYPGNVTSVPAQLQLDLQNAFKANPDAFQLVVPNASPPIISPTLDIQGNPATPLLTSTCKGLKIYNPVTDSCV